MLQRTRSFALLLALAAPALLAGCLQRTVVGGAEGGGAPEDDGSEDGWATFPAVTDGAAVSVASTVVTGPDASTTEAVAAFDLGEFPCDSVPCPPADMLYLVGDSDGVVCSDPLGGHRTTDGYAFRIGLPPALQRVGRYELAGRDDVFSVQSFWEGDGATIGVGYGNASGTLEIISIDETTIVFHVGSLGHDVPLAGEYVASRCGPISLPPEGIAYHEGDTVTLVVGDTIASCDEELLTECEDGTWQIAVTIPSGYLVAGTIALDDPLVTSTACGAPADVADRLELVVFDDGSIVAHFIEATDHLVELEQDLRIASCP